MTLDEAKKAISNHSPVDYHFEDDNTWRWMIPTCLSDDESIIYYKVNGMGLTCSNSRLDEIIVDKIG